jgi:hypothetical protein
MATVIRLPATLFATDGRNRRCCFRVRALAGPDSKPANLVGGDSMSHPSSMDENQTLEDFTNFTHSVAAARALLVRARDSGSYIEGLVLYASLIDALLRILVAHATGRREGHITQLDPRHFRHDKTLWPGERDIYRAARDAGVISERVFQELQQLYTFRNRAIHRFIISGITYDELVPRLDAYEVVFKRLYEQLEAIEQPAPPLDEEEVAAVRARIARKLGDDQASGPQPER